MRATFNIPDDLFVEVQKLSKAKNKTTAIITALEAYVRDKKLAELRGLRGKIPLAYDWRQEEAAELRAEEERNRLLEP